MRKNIFVLCLGLIMLPLLGIAQIKEGTVKVGKSKKAGYIAVSKYDHEMVEEAITGKLTEAGIKKHKKKKKFYTYSGVSVPEISTNKIDLYYKVQQKKHKSNIYFVVSKGYDNYVTSANDVTTSANITNFLTSVDAVVAHNAEVKAKETELLAMNAKLAEDKENMKKAEEEQKRKNKELEALKKK